MSVRRHLRTLALALAAVLSWSVGAECAAVAASAASSYMACCKDGELKCASHGSAADCCATDAARPRTAIAIAKANPVHALTAVAAWAVVPELATLDSQRTLTHPPVWPPHLDDGPPLYIAFSSLLI